MTGYTVGLITGETKTFNDYVLRCARAFGAAQHQQKEPLDVLIKEKEVVDIYKDEIKEVKKKIKELENITDNKLYDKIRTEINEAKEYLNNDTKKRADLVAKCKELMTIVEYWQPPTLDHNGLKDFMINQLEVTIQKAKEVNHTESIEELEGNLSIIDVKQEREKRLDSLKKQLEKYTQRQVLEKEQTEKNNKWIKELYGSLKNEAVLI